jgi:uncharacterized damage-inducible protein DinB
MTKTLTDIFIRDLNRLKKEIELYNNETALWLTDKNISNSAGNLCLHLIGNLNTFIGAILANTGYVRHRELEFSLKNIPRAELLQKIDETINVVSGGLSNIDLSVLEKNFPVLIWDKPMTTEYTLVHLLTHLSYHLGQINYHRRLLDF